MTMEYFVTASVWSAIGLIVGFMLGIGVRVKILHKRLHRVEIDRAIGIFIIGVALLAQAQSILFQHHQQRITSCQARYNEAFQDVLQERARIADEDRRNTTNMVIAVSSAKARQEIADALAKYIKLSNQLDQERRSNTFPIVPKKACK